MLTGVGVRYRSAGDSNERFLYFFRFTLRPGFKVPKKETNPAESLGFFVEVVNYKSGALNYSATAPNFSC